MQQTAVEKLTASIAKLIQDYFKDFAKTDDK